MSCANDDDIKFILEIDWGSQHGRGWLLEKLLETGDRALF
jgi:hypothetical protein